MKHVLIFKTDIKSRVAIMNVATILNAIPTILRWTVDRDDIDNVLRIESLENNPNDIRAVLNAAGYVCDALVYAL